MVPESCGGTTTSAERRIVWQAHNTPCPPSPSGKAPPVWTAGSSVRSDHSYRQRNGDPSGSGAVTTRPRNAGRLAQLLAESFVLPAGRIRSTEPLSPIADPEATRRAERGPQTGFGRCYRNRRRGRNSSRGGLASGVAGPGAVASDGATDQEDKPAASGPSSVSGEIPPSVF